MEELEKNIVKKEENGVPVTPETSEPVAVEASEPALETPIEKKEQPETLSSVEVANVHNKEQKPAAIIPFFVVLLAAVILLPHAEDIIGWVKEKINPGTVAPTVVPKDDDDDNPANPTVDDEFYELTATSIKNTEIAISSLAFGTSPEGNRITFNAKSVNASVSLSNSYSYLEFYSESKTLMERIMLRKEVNLTNGQEIMLSYSVTSTSAKYVKLIIINETSYPVFNAKVTDGIGLLVCSQGPNQLTYRFKENKLYEIVDNVTYYQASLLDQYAIILNEQRAVVAGLNLKSGVSSTLVEADQTFTVSTTVSLDSANIAEFNNKNYYRLDTDAKVMNFELSAQGYVCN